MANKYDTHIKPFIKEIKSMYEAGYTENEIYTTLGVGKDLWAKSKKEKKELSAALNKEEKVKKEMKDLIAFKNTVMPIEKYNDLLKELLEVKTTENGIVISPSIDGVLKVLRQQYPKLNHYLQEEINKNKIAWYEAETKRMQAEKPTINVSNEISLKDEMMELLSKNAKELEDYNQNEGK
ncbi:MAG: hypothetical protein ACK5LC_13230 [Coprobacillaceae bacterium]